MGYRLNDRDVKITGKRLTRIGNGKTGNVYRYKNKALKIFNPDKEAPIDIETASYLSTISTSRILLPRQLLFYNDHLRGYTYKLVHKKNNGKTISTIPKGEFIGNIAILERDIERLSRKRVLLIGISPENSIFSNGLYLVDPSRYSILDIFSTEELEELERINKGQLHLLLSSLIAADLRKSGLDSGEEQLQELLEFKDDNENSSDFFIDIMSGTDSIKELVKKIERQ